MGLRQVGTVTLVSVGEPGGSVECAPRRRCTRPPLPGREAPKPTALLHFSINVTVPIKGLLI